MRKLIIWLVLPVLFIGCTNTVPEPVNISSITSNYELSASQRLTPNGSVYQLMVQTIGSTDCLNDEIDAYLNDDSSTITLNIDGILNGDPCNDGETFPRIDLDLQESQGEVPFEINIQTLPTITGTINYEESAFFIYDLSSQGIKLNRDHIFKVPEGMGWGYIDENSATDLNLDEIRAFFNLSPTANPDFDLIGDDYGFFTINEDNDLEISEAPAGSDIFVFDARSDVFWNEMTMLMGQYTIKYPEMELSFFRWNGDAYDN